MSTVFVYGNGVLLSEDKVSEISGKVVNVLKTELQRSPVHRGHRINFDRC